mgnify:CR=1 FL=1
MLPDKANKLTSCVSLTHIFLASKGIASEAMPVDVSRIDGIGQ